MTRLKKIFSTELGASLIEYALLILFLVVVAIVGVKSLGSQVSTSFSGINSGFATN